MKKWTLVLSFFVCSNFVSAQDIAFGKKMLDTLTSTSFWGRGYTKDGMKKAADFLEEKFKSFGLQPLKGTSYLQKLSFPVNTFPGDMKVSINGKQLIPGVDFIVSPGAKGFKDKGKLKQFDSTTFVNYGNSFFVELKDKLTWSVSLKEDDYTLIKVKSTSIKGKPKKYNVSIENVFIPKFDAVNVLGYVPGTTHPDSIIFITAHYDHLGGMGADTYFPGANDNASGVSLLLNLARYYAKHPQKYSIGFICFAAEEAGLIGSKYYTEHPILPLKNIRFLINTDLAGTGDDGITIVNATEFPKEFELINKVNDENNLVKKIFSRGKAPNSDHYFFSEKGVPAFFFYTMGGNAAYHDVFDKGNTLPLNKHEDLFKLVVGFNDKLMNQ